MAGKKQTPAQSSYTEFDDDETDGEAWDEETEVDAEEDTLTPAEGARTRDWRDVERYREERALRRLIADEFDDFDDLDDKPARRR